MQTTPNTPSAGPVQEPPLFENRFIMTAPLYREYCRYALSITYRITCYVLGDLFLLFAVVFSFLLSLILPSHPIF